MIHSPEHRISIRAQLICLPSGFLIRTEQFPAEAKRNENNMFFFEFEVKLT